MSALPPITWFDSSDLLEISVVHIDPPRDTDADPVDQLTIATPTGTLVSIKTACGDDVANLVMALRFTAETLERHAGGRP